MECNERNESNLLNSSGEKDKLRHFARRVIHNKYLELFILFLIILTFVLFVAELLFPVTASHLWFNILNCFILVVFAVEIIFRRIASKSTKEFIANCWVDIIALLPFLTIFKELHFLKVLRIFRLVSLLIFSTRHLRFFSFIFKKKMVEHIIILLVILFIVIFATASFVYCEQDKMLQGSEPLETAFWISIFSLFAGEFANSFPETLGGKLTLLLVTFTGMGFFALLTGTVSAFFIERVKEGAILGKINFNDLDDHVIICGWNKNVPTVLMELQAHEELKDRDFVLIADILELPDMTHQGVDMTSVYFISQDFVNVEVLKSANIEHASIAIIVADTNDRTEIDADARTVLTALTIEKLNPLIYSCAELIHPENESHLRIGKVDAVVLSTNMSAYIITQAALKKSVIPFYTELLRPSQGNQIFEVDFPPDFIGKSFTEQMPLWKFKYKALLVGIQNSNGDVKINPNECIVEKGDKAIVIACKKPRTTK